MIKKSVPAGKTAICGGTKDVVAGPVSPEGFSMDLAVEVSSIMKESITNGGQFSTGIGNPSLDSESHSIY